MGWGGGGVGGGGGGGGGGGQVKFQAGQELYQVLYEHAKSLQFLFSSNMNS